jgi:hypothetical protein
MESFDMHNEDYENSIPPYKKYVLIAMFLIIVWCCTVAGLVLIFTSTNFGCNCDNQESNKNTLKKQYIKTVEAFAGTKFHEGERVCWTREFDDDDTPILYALFKDPMDNEIPWQIIAQGQMCYKELVVPGPTSLLYVPKNWSSYTEIPSIKYPDKQSPSSESSLHAPSTTQILQWSTYVDDTTMEFSSQ